MLVFTTSVLDVGELFAQRQGELARRLLVEEVLALEQPDRQRARELCHAERLVGLLVPTTRVRLRPGGNDFHRAV